MYTVSEIQKILDADRIPLLSKGVLADSKTAIEPTIEHLAFDSRRLVAPAQTLFLALKGNWANDGHRFIGDAYARGVRAFVISENVDFQQFSNAFFLKTDAVLRGLQGLTRVHRQRFLSLPIIGITGSNGKTVVKEWLYQLLRADQNIVRSPKSFNSQIGLPMSVWQIRAEHTLGIFEVGISKKGEMAVSQSIIAPLRFGILTNIGAAHDAGFENREAKVLEKIKLFDQAETVILPAKILQDYPSVFNQIVGEADRHAANLITWSFGEKANLQIIENQIIENKTRLKAVFQKCENDPRQELSIEIPFTDLAAIENAITCWLTLLLMGYTNTTIAERMCRLEPVEMRLELKAGINGCVVVNDAYSNDPTSLSIALDFLVQQGGANRRRTVITTPTAESHTSAAEMAAFLGKAMQERGVSRFFGIGFEVANQPKLPPSVSAQFFADVPDFLSHILNSDFTNEAILIKGKRAEGLERIADRLAAKMHKTILEINLVALAHNFDVFQRILRKNTVFSYVSDTFKVSDTLPTSPTPQDTPSVKTKTMAMVKAAAYGNGSDEVARLLERRGVDYLAVAYADEGIELRHAGIKVPIMVMNPNESSFDALLRFNLEPEIYSLSLLEKFATFTQSQIPNPQSPITIHLKLDTGMHRLGFEPIDCQQLVSILVKNPQLQIASIFTHLAASEAADHDGFTTLQISRFEAMYAQITEGVGYRPMRHVLNSSGIVRFPQYHFEMVRLGIGLYGVESSREIQTDLLVVQTLKATISQIRNVPKTETVGYSRRGKLTRDSRIATISIGYADGLLRGSGNGSFAVGLHGKRAPIVGGVCMDMTMIDVTDIPEAAEGDTVEIFGVTIPVQELAAALDTIPYEVFTGISERVKRVYFSD
jgi:Alr-MurF fusion protein